MFLINFAQPAQQVLQVPGEECAVQVFLRGQVFVPFVHHIGVGAVVHKREDTVGVAANHLAVSPGNCGSYQGSYFYVGHRGEAARELHRIVVDERRMVYACRLRVEERAYVGGNLVH